MESPLFFGNASLESKLKEQLGEKVKESLFSSADNNAETAVEQIAKTLDEIVEQADSGMKREIGSLRENIQKILQVKKDGESNAQAKESCLDAQQKKAEGLIDSIEELTEAF